MKTKDHFVQVRPPAGRYDGMWANLAIGGLQIFASELNVSFDVAPNRLRLNNAGTRPREATLRWRGKIR